MSKKFLFFYFIFMRNKISALGVKTLLKYIVSKIGNWLLVWIWIILSIWIFGIIYAWTNLDPNDAASWKPLTSTLMQWVINNINELNGKFWTLTNTKMCTSDWTKVNCNTDIPVAWATTWAQNWTDVYYNWWNVWIWTATPATWVKLDVQGGQFKLKWMFLDYITGTNPVCSTWVALLKKYTVRTCTSNWSCTTIWWWLSNNTGCTYYISATPTTCVAPWTDVICIGN